MFNNTIKFLILLLITPSALGDTIYLTSLDWAPYSGKQLKEQGASVAVAKAAFKVMGHDLKVDFFPWSRAIKNASSPTSKYVGYFPEYRSESEDFTFSNAMGQSPLGIVENKSNPIVWKKVEDFSQYKLGVVQDYINTKELDDLIAKGVIKAKAVTSDLINVKKVAGGRLDAAVIDANVLAYMIKSNKKLSSVKDKVQMNSNILKNKELVVAFNNSADGKKWLAIYNEGLSKVDIEKIMAGYLQ